MDIRKVVFDYYKGKSVQFLKGPNLFYMKGKTQLTLVFRCVIQISLPYEEMEILFDAESGKIIQSNNLVVGCSFSVYGEHNQKIKEMKTRELYVQRTGKIASPLNSVFVQGTGTVFKPDPLTSSGSQYGDTGFTDNNDQDSPQLTAQLFEVTLDSISYDNVTGYYSLVGPYCSITSIEPPYYPGDSLAYARDTSDFSTTRSDSTFEAVMAYYHITKSQKWIQSLGFYSIQNASMQVDPHALNDTNNAHYLSASNRIVYGYANDAVDISEDTTAIIHEYGHALQNYTGNYPFEDLNSWSLSEGFADYWAGSYARSYFDTDSVNRWAGRESITTRFKRTIIDDTLTYLATLPYYKSNGSSYGKEETVYRVYYNGTIWACTLTQIAEILGRSSTDKIVLESILQVPETVELNAIALLSAVNTIYHGSPDSI